MWKFLKGWNQFHSTDEYWLTRRLADLVCFAAGASVGVVMHWLGLPGYSEGLPSHLGGAVVELKACQIVGTCRRHAEAIDDTVPENTQCNRPEVLCKL